MRSVHGQLGVGLWGCLMLLSDVGQERLILREGPPLNASLQAIDGQGNLTFNIQGESRQVPPSELIAWGHVPDNPRGTQFLLNNGDLLVAHLTQVRMDEVVAESELWRSLALSRHGSLRGILFQLPTDPWERDQLLDRVRGARSAEDHFWLVNGDELSGRLLPTPTGEGLAELFGLTSLSVRLEGADEPTSLDSKNVVAVSLACLPVEAESQRPVQVSLAFRDGSRVGALGIVPKDNRWELELACGISLVVDRARLLREVTFVQPRHPRVRYLSDMEPAGYAHVPFLTSPWPFGRDRNVLGGRLRCGGHLYLKGLGMQSTSRLVYDLEETDRFFQAELALDDSAGQVGSVTFRVFLERGSANGAPARWKPAYESPIIRPGHPPTAISLGLDGVRRIALVVDRADRGDVLDHANWLGARLVK